MTTFNDETLMAFVDGDLDPAQAVQVQLALIANADLAKRIERFRYVRRALRSTYDSVVKEPVPDHLLAILGGLDQPAADKTEDAAPEPSAEVPARARGLRPPASWAAIAASLLVGVLLGRAIRKHTDHE